MTPSSPCAYPSPAVSNEITMTVNSGGPASVTIAASQTTICAGQLVTFTGTITNGGTDPAYEWTLNGNVVGSDTNVYQTTSLANGDVVRLTMQPYGSCAGNAAVYSNSITMTVGSGVTPSVNIAATTATVCSGQTVTFTATPVNSGSTPAYQWKHNGNNVGTNSNTWQNASLVNGDMVWVVMTSSLGCASPASVASNSITMTNGTTVTPAVSIAADYTTMCAGGVVTFTATPVNGGSTPTYQWRVNNNDVSNSNSSSYQTGLLANGDVVSVVMTSSLACANPVPVSSNSITMTITPDPVTVYRDLDGDGYGSQGSGAFISCAVPAGYVTNNLDCNDNNATIYPGSPEICGNGVDENCNGQVDENCSAVLPVLQLRTYPVKEGNTGYTLLIVQVALDIPAPLPVSVNYSTRDDEAIAGLDYVAASGLLTIPAGSKSATLQLRIIGDLLNESNEGFWINFNNLVNVVAGNVAQSRIMIIDDDKKTNKSGRMDNLPETGESLTIPSVLRRTQVWVIPQIGNYENEVLILDAQGTLVSRFINYRNQASFGKLAAGMYFYRIRIKQTKGGDKYYTGRLLITD